MSFESWCEEFYPVSASECPKEQAAEHSLKKWQGIRKEHLEKHGVTYCYGTLREDRRRYLSFDANSCSLCRHYVDEDNHENYCTECPLFLVRGKVPCFTARHDEKESPFHESDRNVEPMITWLEKAVEYERSKK